MYTWAVNKLKLLRAIEMAKRQQNETEENVKQHYLLLGGLVKEVPKKPGRPKNVDKHDDQKGKE